MKPSKGPRISLALGRYSPRWIPLVPYLESKVLRLAWVESGLTNGNRHSVSDLSDDVSRQHLPGACVDVGVGVNPV